MQGRVDIVGYSNEGTIKCEVWGIEPCLIEAASHLLVALEAMINFAKEDRVPKDIVLWQAEKAVAWAKKGPE